MPVMPPMMPLLRLAAVCADDARKLDEAGAVALATAVAVAAAAAADDCDNDAADDEDNGNDWTLSAFMMPSAKRKSKDKKK